MDSIIKTNMVSTRRKKKKNTRLFIKLDETAYDSINRNANTSVEDTDVVGRGHQNNISYETNHPTAESGSQVKMQTLEKSISDKDRGDVENVVATVETRVHEAIIYAMDNLVVPGVELAMKSVDIFSASNPSSEIVDHAQGRFLGDTNELQ